MHTELAATFLLAFPALFSIVNPVAGAFVFNEATANRDDPAIARLFPARRFTAHLLGAGRTYGMPASACL